MGQDMDASPISIREYALEAIHEFVYLGSTITDTLSFETEFNRCIGKGSYYTLQADKKSLDKQ